MEALLLLFLVIGACGILAYPTYQQFWKKDHHARGVFGIYLSCIVCSMIIIFLFGLFAFFSIYSLFLGLIIGTLFLGAFVYTEDELNITEVTAKIMKGILAGMVVLTLIFAIFIFALKTWISWMWWGYYTPSSLTAPCSEISEFFLSFLFIVTVLLLFYRRGFQYRNVAYLFLGLALASTGYFVIMQIQYFPHAALDPVFSSMIRYDRYGNFVWPADLGGTDVNNIFMLIVRDPLVQIIAAIMTFGGLLKAIDIFSAEMLSKVILIFIPSIIWVMTFIGLIPVPDAVTALFQGFEWFGWFFYVFLVGLVFVIIISMINLFASLPSGFKIPS